MHGVWVFEHAVADQFEIGIGRFPRWAKLFGRRLSSGSGRGSNQKYAERSQFPHNFFMRWNAPVGQ